MQGWEISLYSGAGIIIIILVVLYIKARAEEKRQLNFQEVTNEKNKENDQEAESPANN